MKQSRVVVPFGSTQIIMTDYFNPWLTIQITVISGSTTTVTATAEDPNDPTYTATYVALPAPLNVGITSSGIFPLQQAQYRALKFVVTVAGSAAITVLQGSGDGGIS